MAIDEVQQSESPSLQEEKKVKDVDLVESVESASTSSLGFDQVQTKKLLRKIDYTLVPFLALLYL